MTGVFAIFLLALTTPNLTTEKEIDEFQEESINYLDTDLGQAMEMIDHSIEEAQDIGYNYGEAYGLYLKAYIHRVQDDLGKAFVVNLKALNVIQFLHDERAIDTKVRLYVNTGEILKKHFQYKEAIQYYSEGLEIAKEYDLDQWVINLTYNIGNAHRWQGDLNSAVDYIHKAYQLAKKGEDERVIVNSLNLMGLVFKETGRYDTASLYFKKMLNYPFEKLNADKYKGRAYHNLANTYKEAGDTVLAEQTFLKSLEHKRTRGKISETFITEVDLAELYYERNRLIEAEQLSANCLSGYEDVRLDPEHYKIFDLCRKINFALGDYQSVDYYASRYVDESTAFIKQQEVLIKVRDQFKMEILTASFFGELERNKRISKLWDAIYFILLLSTTIISVMVMKRIWVRKEIEKEVKKLMGDIRMFF